MTDEQREKELADRRAAATPRDFPDDFDKPTTWNVCGKCIKPFLGVVTRIECRLCKEGKGR